MAGSPPRGVAALSMSTATTPWLAPARACLRAVPKSSSAPGCASRARLWGPEGQVVPQQWLAHTTAPGVPPGDRRRLDLVIYGTLVSPLARDGTPHCGAADRDGAVLRTAERRKRATWRPPTPSSHRGGRNSSACLVVRSGGAGTPRLRQWCDAWSACGPAAPRHLCARLPASPGHAGGGAPCPSHASRRSAQRRWGGQGR